MALNWNAFAETALTGVGNQMSVNYNRQQEELKENRKMDRIAQTDMNKTKAMEQYKTEQATAKRKSLADQMQASGNYSQEEIDSVASGAPLPQQYQNQQEITQQTALQGIKTQGSKDLATHNAGVALSTHKSKGQIDIDQAGDKATALVKGQVAAAETMADELGMQEGTKERDDFVKAQVIGKKKEKDMSDEKKVEFRSKAQDKAIKYLEANPEAANSFESPEHAMKSITEAFYNDMMGDTKKSVSGDTSSLDKYAPHIQSSVKRMPKKEVVSEATKILKDSGIDKKPKNYDQAAMIVAEAKTRTQPKMTTRSDKNAGPTVISKEKQVGPVKKGAMQGNIGGGQEPAWAMDQMMPRS